MNDMGVVGASSFGSKKPENDGKSKGKGRFAI
jgi:hypothetical protein